MIKGIDKQQHFRVGKLHLVDLAGRFPTNKFIIFIMIFVVTAKLLRHLKCCHHHTNLQNDECSMFTFHVQFLQRAPEQDRGKWAEVEGEFFHPQSVKKTPRTHIQEATKINLSLSTLGNVISALVDGKSTHVPYRSGSSLRS